MTFTLAEEFLKLAEELVDTEESQDRFLEALEQVEKLLPDDFTVLCRSARVLYRYGLLHSKGRFFLLALDKLKLAEEKHAALFSNQAMWWQLWGNILVQLGKLLDESDFFERAIVKYEKAAQISGSDRADINWDCAEAWIFLGQISQELCDLQQGLIKFHHAQQAGVTSLFFDLDYANAFMQMGRFTGNPEFLEQALALLRKVIANSYHPETSNSIVYTLAWRRLGVAMKMRFQLTHRKDHLEEADAALRDAILSDPNQGDLWLEWGHLFLHAGWIAHDFKLVEMGLEKLTSSKIKECDPLRASFLLGMGLLIFGLFLENYKLLQDGQERILAALKVAPDHPQLLFASGFAELAIGLYFSDEERLMRAATIFEKRIVQECHAIESWHALFQSYLSWGLQCKNKQAMQKAIKAIARVCELRPFSYVYRNQWGHALLCLHDFGCSMDERSAYIEEAVIKFGQAAALYDDEEILFNWGCALDLLGNLTANEEDYARAVDLLSKVLERITCPGRQSSNINPVGIAHLFGLHQHKGLFELTVRNHLGLALTHLGRLTSNKECLRQAIEILDYIAKIEQENALIWCNLGYALLNLSDLLLDVHDVDESTQRKNDAERALMHAAELGSYNALYHLACLYSLSGCYASSLLYLQKAQKHNALPSLEELERENWLREVRKTEEFQNFFSTWEQDG